MTYYAPYVPMTSVVLDPNDFRPRKNSMKPFEHVGPDNVVHIHEDNWRTWRYKRFAEYPCPEGRYRFEVHINHARRNIFTVPIVRNPHVGLDEFPRYDGRYCFYHCDDWSTIFEAQFNHTHGGFRLFIESGNADPIWGERIIMFSTSSSLEDEPWGHNEANVFCYFRDHYWRVTYKELFHEWHAAYPITRDREFIYGRGQPGGYPGQERVWPDNAWPRYRNWRNPDVGGIGPIGPIGPIEIQLEMPEIQLEMPVWNPVPTKPELFEDLGLVTKHLMESWVEFNGRKGRM